MHLPRFLLFVGLTSLLVACAAPRGTHHTFNVLDYGAVGDARTDCTAAFQQAVDAATRAGATLVSVPEGAYRFNGHLTIPNSVTLEGNWRALPMLHYRYKDYPKEPWTGSTLLPTEGAGKPDGPPFLTLMSNAGIKGLIVYYPDQTETNPPVAYPWTVASGGADNCTILDCLLVNPYQAVDFGSKVSGRHLIRGLYAQPLYRGLFIDQCYDIGRVEDVHFWPFWKGEGPIKRFMETQGEAFLIGRSDWEYMMNCFCIWYHVGWRLGDFGHGPGNPLLTQCGSDIGPIAVAVDAVQAHAGASFLNGQLYGGVLVGEKNNGPVRFTGCGFFGSTDGNNEVSHGVIRGNGQVSFSNCHFITLDPANEQNRVWRVESGGVSFTGCDFMDAGKEYLFLGADVQSAVVVGNRFRGRMNITNQAKGNVQIGLNTDNVRTEEVGAIVVDNSARDGSFTRDNGWNVGFTGTDYLGGMCWALPGKGDIKTIWTPDLPAAGTYDVFVWFGADNNNDRATNAPFAVHYAGGSQTFRVNLKQDTGRWYRLGAFPFEKGKSGSVVLTNDADGCLAADAVKFLPVTP